MRDLETYPTLQGESRSVSEPCLFLAAVGALLAAVSLPALAGNNDFTRLHFAAGAGNLAMGVAIDRARSSLGPESDTLQELRLDLSLAGSYTARNQTLIGKLHHVQAQRETASVHCD